MYSVLSFTKLAFKIQFYISDRIRNRIFEKVPSAMYISDLKKLHTCICTHSIVLVDLFTYNLNSSYNILNN